MRAEPLEAFEPLALSILQKHGAITANYDPAYFRAALAIVKEKIKLGRELPEWMSYFFHDDFPYDEAAAKKVFTPEGLANIGRLRERLAALDEKSFTSAGLETEFKTIARRDRPESRRADPSGSPRRFRPPPSARASIICWRCWVKRAC